MGDSEPREPSDTDDMKCHVALGTGGRVLFFSAFALLNISCTREIALVSNTLLVVSF